MKRTRWIVGVGGAYELLELGYLNANSLSKVILEGINCKDTSGVQRIRMFRTETMLLGSMTKSRREQWKWKYQVGWR